MHGLMGRFRASRRLIGLGWIGTGLMARGGDRPVRIVPQRIAVWATGLASRPSPKTSGSSYLTKLRYEASASTSSGPSVLATIGIGDPGVE